MRPSLKHLVLLLAVVAGTTALNAGDRGLPRILDPLHILPSPRQVLRTLDHAVRVLPPPVVVETRGYPVYDTDYDCDYRAYPVGWYAPRPVGPVVVGPYGRYPYGRVYRNERFERHDRFERRDRYHGHHEGRR
jgi:hypothetical protein